MGVGVVSPFQDDADYCKEYYDQCTCCGQTLDNERLGICRNFMGYGSCIDGIKAAIARKKQQCRQQQRMDDYQRDQRRADLDRILDDAFSSSQVALSARAEGNATLHEGGRLGPYDMECL